MKIDGGCHCGAITYEAELDPDKVAICHCTDCQAMSASAFRTLAMVEESKFILLSGTPNIYVKVAESGNEREQAFCGTCGAGIYAAPVGEGPRMLGLRLGTARQRDQLVPKVQVWATSALPWVDDIGQIRKVDRQPG